MRRCAIWFERLAGTLDLGIETLRADSLTLLEARILRTDPATGAETRQMTLLRRRKLTPTAFDDALSLPGAEPRLDPVRGRVAVLASGREVVGDQGELLPTLRLVQPFKTRTIVGHDHALERWETIGTDLARQRWEAEIAAAPSHREDKITLLTGLILPLWRHLPKQDQRVRRCRLDDGTRLLGRLLEPEQIGPLHARLGLAAETLEPAAMIEAATERGARFNLSGWVQLRRTLVAGRYRLELTGLPADDIAWAKAAGAWTEIIRYQTRVFLDADPGRAEATLAAAIARYGLEPAGQGALAPATAAE